MKKTALIFIFIFILSFINTTNAQWYYSSCGVTDINNCTSEEFECLWNKASKNVISGAIVTAIGTSIIIGGFVMVATSDETASIHSFVPTASDYGALLIISGFIIDAVGFLLLKTGAIHRSELKKTPNYDTFKLASFKVSPSIGVNQFNNTPNYGVTLSFTF